MKEETKKEENEMPDQPEEKDETELRSDMGQLLQEFESLELQMRKLKAGVSADSLDPTDNYSFARMVIEGEVETLSAAVSGLQQRLNNDVDMLLISFAKVKQLVFLVQDRQEKMYKELQCQIGNMNEALKAEIEKVELVSNESVKKVEQMFMHQGKDDKRNFLREIDKLRRMMGDRQNEADLDRKATRNDARSFRTDCSSNFRMLAQYVTGLAEVAGHDRSLSKLGLDEEMKKIQYVIL